MRVYILRFEALGPLMRAFDRALESAHVTSCMIESEQSQLRFIAPEKAADDIVEHIYLDGGLVWCSRHEVPAD